VVAGLADLDAARARRWCEQRVPDDVRDQIGVECAACAGIWRSWSAGRPGATRLPLSNSVRG